MDTIVKINHNAGFFSCCAIQLGLIIEYIKKYKKLPEKVDSSSTFEYYKYNKEDDISTLFFEEQDIEIPYKDEMQSLYSIHDFQFNEYRYLPFGLLQPFIQKYYSPSKNILDKIAYLEKKYELDYENLCGVRFRGTDKQIETNQPRYDEMIQKVMEVKSEYAKVVVLTDEVSFTLQCFEKIPNCIAFEETYLTTDKLEMIQFFVASIYIFSKMKTVVCTSGNAEFFLSLFRGNTESLHQYLNPKSHIYGFKNKSYDPTKTYFWL